MCEVMVAPVEAVTVVVVASAVEAVTVVVAAVVVVVVAAVVVGVMVKPRTAASVTPHAPATADRTLAWEAPPAPSSTASVARNRPKCTVTVPSVGGGSKRKIMMMRRR